MTTQLDAYKTEERWRDGGKKTIRRDEYETGGDVERERGRRGWMGGGESDQ